MPREPLEHESLPSVTNPPQPADVVTISVEELAQLRAAASAKEEAKGRAIAANRRRGNGGRFQKKGAAPAVQRESHRQEIDTRAMPIEQRPVVTDEASRSFTTEVDPSVLAKKEYLDLLAMGEEPVTIRISPSTEKNAPTSYPAWVNGEGAEALVNGRWERLPFAHVPVGGAITLKRKYVEVLARAKIDAIETDHGDSNVALPHNRTRSTTSSLCSFTIVRDDNPRARQWLEDLMRRNY